MEMGKEIVEWLGDINLLKVEKTAFLCSSKYSATSVLKSYDWAVEQRNGYKCVISGFHSALEKDVLKLLLEGSQPIIIALARGMNQRIDAGLIKAIKDGRLLIITPFKQEIKYITKENAQSRNRLITDLAEKITVAHISKGGKLEDLVNGITDKMINYL